MSKKRAERKATIGAEQGSEEPRRHGFMKRILQTKRGKTLVLSFAILLLGVVYFLIPTTRYMTLAPFIKKETTVTVVDARTGRPVSNATVNLAGSSVQTNKDGVAAFEKVAVGQYELSVEKQYHEQYKQGYTIPVLSSPQPVTAKVSATGREVRVGVTDTLTHTPLSNVLVNAGDAKATTDDRGIATLIVSPTLSLVKATLEKSGYNAVPIEINPEKEGAYSITPGGSVYYLSKATGIINVMKANLDGTGAQVAVEGTGRESDYETVFLATSDWRYAALSATRSNNAPGLYLFDTEKSELSVIDEGDASFSVIGWSGRDFVYNVYRNTPNIWDNKRQALKSFNADTKKITIIDETSGQGTGYYDYAYEMIGPVSLIKGQVFYLKSWNQSYYNGDPGRVTRLFSAKNGGSAKSLVKTFNQNAVSMTLYKPDELRIRVSNPSGAPTFEAYKNGGLTPLPALNDNQFNAFTPLYFASPSGNKTFWYEPRDGKNTLFIGDASANNAIVVGSLSEYTPYGWFGVNDEYILLSKSGSELYISPAGKVIDEGENKPVKITDYHRTSPYGYGYGG